MKVIAIIAVVAAVALQQTSAAPTGLSDEKVKGCLAKIDEKIDTLVVPELVEKLGDFIRQLNPNFDHPLLPLAKLIADPRAEVDVRNAGFVPAAEDNKYVEACGDYLLKYKEVTQDTECGDEFFLKFDEPQYESLLSEHHKISDKNAYANVCLAFLQ